jgi:hypothetical protein
MCGREVPTFRKKDRLQNGEIDLFKEIDMRKGYFISFSFDGPLFYGRGSHNYILGMDFGSFCVRFRRVFYWLNQ